MVLTLIITRVRKNSLTLTYPPNINKLIGKCFGHPSGRFFDTNIHLYTKPTLLRLKCNHFLLLITKVCGSYSFSFSCSSNSTEQFHTMKLVSHGRSYVDKIGLQIGPSLSQCMLVDSITKYIRPPKHVH